MKYAALFDLDGVLLETEPLKARAHSAACAHFGGDVAPVFYANVMGRAHSEVRTAFMTEAGIAPEPSEYSRVFRERYQQLIDTEAAVCPGVPALLRALREQDFGIAVITSSARWMLHPLLPNLFGAECFDLVISGDDVPRHKPAPDGYLQALDALRPDRAIAFEDTATGLASAVSAGLPVIAVRHGLNAAHDLSPAVQVFPGFHDTAAVLALVNEILSRR